MNKLMAIIFIMGSLLIFSCTNPVSDGNFSAFSFEEDEFDSLVLDVCLGTAVSDADFDNLILPSTRAIKVDRLEKWLFGDEYLTSLDHFTGSPEVVGDPFINTWGSGLWQDREGIASETVRRVNGIIDDKVRVVYQITDDSDPKNGLYHVYRYQEWQQDISDFSLNVWFGPNHIFYQNLKSGAVEPGEPYMELFPTNSSADSVVAEVRIEKTSFFKFRSLYSGNWTEDRGSLLSHLITVLGTPDSENEVASMDDIDWSARNTLFTYPLSDTMNGGYIHYNLPADVKVRIFLGGTGDEELRILSMYFVQD